jgi:spore cortex formation protein SpoVR/YcgB (stage V sporulation)
MATYDELQAEIAEKHKEAAKALKDEALKKVEETIQAAEKAQSEINVIVVNAKKDVDAQVDETKRILEAAQTDIKSFMKEDLDAINGKISDLKKKNRDILTKINSFAETLEAAGKALKS